MKLHVRVIEATNLPRMDVGGLCDAYCRLYVGMEKFKTRTIENSLNPKFRQDFHFKVEHFATDKFKLEVYDYDRGSKDDLVGDIEVFIKDLAPGAVIEQTYGLRKSINSQVRLWLHLAQEKDTPFVQKPFDILLAHVRVMEGRDLKRGDYQCSVSLGTTRPMKTRVQKNTERPDWQDEFEFIVQDREKDEVSLNLFCGSTNVGKAAVPIKDFEIGKVVKQWVDIEGKTRIRCAFHIAPATVAAFAGEEWDEFPAIETNVELYVRVLEARGIPKSDVVGESDPYCVMWVSSYEKEKKRTRIIENNCNPKWNQQFQFPIGNLTFDQFTLSVYDYDGVGNKDDKLGSYTVILRSLQYGVCEDRWVRLDGRGGEVHIVTYLGMKGSVPFVDKPFAPYFIGLIVVEALDIPKMDMIGLTDAFCKVKLSTEAIPQQTQVVDNSLHPIWDQRFTFISPVIEDIDLEIEMFDEDPGSSDLISVTKMQQIQEYVGNEGFDMWLDMTPAKGVKKGGRLHVVVKVSQSEPDLFNGMNFQHAPDLVDEEKEKKRKEKKEKKDKKRKEKESSKEKRRHKKRERSKSERGKRFVNETFPQGLTLFISLIDGTNIPVMDPNGLADPYVTFKIKGKSGKEKSSIQYETLTPVWNEMFRLNVLDFDDDVLEMTAMDYDKVGKDDLIGSCEIPVRNLAVGVMKTETFVVYGPGHAANIKIGYFMVYPSTGHDISQWNVYQPLQLHLRVIKGENLPSGSLFVRLAPQNSSRFSETSKKDGPNPEWYNNFKLDAGSIFGGVKVTLYQFAKGKESAVDSAMLDVSDLQIGTVVEKSVTVKGGKIYFACDYEPQGVPTKLPEVQQGGYMCSTMTLNVRIIEARNIQAMDRNGKSDPYILFYQEGKKKESRQKTKIIQKTLAPVWNEEFHIPIKSISGDVIHFSMRDHDDVGKDDKISFYDLSIATLQVGEVVDRWFDFAAEKKVKLPGQVHMILHLCPPNGYAFCQCTYAQMVVNLLVEEAKDIANMDFGGKSDPYCLIGFPGDKKRQKTKVISNTLTPQWFEMFALPITSMEDDLEIIMRDEGNFRDGDMARVNIPLRNFNPGYVYQDWFEMKPAKGVKKGGQIYLKIHIAEKDAIPFTGIPVPKEPEPAGDVCEMQIDLIRGIDLPGLDAGGKSDPYCKFTWIGRDDKGIQSRIIDNTCNPYWRQKLRMPVLSLGTDILRVEVMDHDQRGKDDRISMIDFPISSLVLGVTRYETFNLTPLDGRRKAGQLEMAIQVTQPGQVPFVDCPFQAYVLNVRLVGCEGLPEAVKCSLQCKVKMAKDARSFLSTVKENQSKACVWNEDFRLTVTNHKSDELDLTIDNTELKKTVAHGTFSIADLVVRETKEIDVELTPGGKVHAYVQIAFAADIPFNDIGLPPVANDHMTLYVKILEGTNIPKMDANGLADPYCSLSLVGRKDVKKTEVRKKTLTPDWSQEFQFPILSYGTDQLKIALYDHDDRGADDKIGEWTKAIREMEAGVVVDTMIQMSGKYFSTGQANVHVIMHLAAAHQPKYQNAPFKPPLAWVEVCEAMDIENVDSMGKSDPFVEVGMLSDVTPQRTRILDDTLTPQWFDRMCFSVTDRNTDVLRFVLKDDGVRNTKMATLEIPVAQFEGDLIYDEWFNMTPAGKCKKGGRLRLRVQVSPFEVSAFSFPEVPKPPLPACQQMEFVVKLIEAMGVPAMDAGASDPYCILEFEGHPNSVQKSRIIDNTLWPRWNQIFRMPVLSLNSNQFRLQMMDHDRLSKDDKISHFTVLLKTLEPGVVYDQEITMVSEPGVGHGGVVKMTYQLCAPNQVPFVSQPFVPYQVHFHLISLANLPGSSELYYCEVSIENDVVPCLTQVSEGSAQVEFCETYNFVLRDPAIDHININVFKHVTKDKRVFPELVAKVSLPLSQFEIGQVCDRTFDAKTEGDAPFQVRGMIQINKVGEPGFAGIQLPQKQPFVGQDARFLHVEIKGCQSLPRMDVNGLCDGYCKVTFKKRKKHDKESRFVGMTRVVKNSINPEFKQTFHIPIHCLDSDVLKISVWDYDQKTKDDKIGTLELFVKQLPRGTVTTETYSIGRQGQITLRTHVSDRGQPAFVANPFQVYRLNLRVWEAMDIKRADTATMSDCYTLMRLPGDVFGQKTSVCDNTQTPQWWETFSFLLDDPATDVLSLKLMDGEEIGKDEFMAQMQLNLSNFNIGYVYDDWHDLAAKKGSGGRIRLGVHVDLENKDPFTGTEVHKPQPEPSEYMELHVKVIDGFNVRNYSGSVGRMDSFCRLEFVGYKESRSDTRVIYNSHNPKWNQTFRMRVISLNSNVFRLTVINKYEKPKHRVVSRDYRLSEFNFGHVYDEKIIVGGMTIHFQYHLTRGGDIPFVEQPFVPLQVNVHVNSLDTQQVTNQPYINAWVNDDRIKTPTTDQPTKVWRETISFLLTNPLSDVAHLMLCDVEGDRSKPRLGKEVCQFSFTTADIPCNTTVDKILENDQGYKLSMKIQVVERGSPVFQGIELPPHEPHVFPRMTLCCHIIEATGLPEMDVRGGCDPFVDMKMIVPKKWKKKGVPKPPHMSTRYCKATLSPVWNQIFYQEIRSLASDKMRLSLKDYDKATSNDKIDSFEKAASNLAPGKVIDECRTLKDGAKLHMKWHLCAPNQPAFVEAPFDLYCLYVRVIEARNFKSGDVVTKADPYVVLGLKNDMVRQRTTASENSLTPQWYQDFTFLITSLTEDSLVVTLKDQNFVSDKAIDSLEIPVNELEIGKTVSGWYKFSKNRKGEIRLLLQVVKKGDPRFADYVEPNEKVTGDFAMFHVKVIEARNLPVMDAGVNSCDAYCNLDFSYRSQMRTRTIDNTLTPIWNQEFHYEIKSLRDDQLMLEVWDHDAKTKDDKIGTIAIRLLEHPYGTVVDQWHPISSALRFQSQVGEVHLLTHITKGGQTSYDDAPFVPLELHTKVKHDESMGYLTEAHPYFKYKLDCDRTASFGQSMGQTIYDLNKFIVTEQTLNKFVIQLFDHKLEGEDEFTECQVIIPLEELKVGEITTKTYKLRGECTIEVSLCLTEYLAPDVFTLEQVPASFKSLSPRADGFRVFTEILTYEGPDVLLGAGIRQQEDPNASISQQIHKLTQPLHNGLYFVHDVKSLNTDSIVFTYYSFVEYGKDKVIDRPRSVLVKSFALGMVVGDETTLVAPGYRATFRIHVAGPEQPPFAPVPLPPMILRLYVFEAVDIPKMDFASKTDCYCAGCLDTDIDETRTKVLDDSQTPQWDEMLTFQLATLKEKLILKLCDDDVTKRKIISQCSIDVEPLKDGAPKYQWIKMAPEKGVKKGGHLCIAMQLTPYGNGIDLRGYVAEPLPEDFEPK